MTAGQIMTRPVVTTVIATALLIAGAAGQPGRAQQRRLVAVFVVDGLRPDSINATDTPTIARLRAEGVEYANSHSIFPTETRVNAAALSSGAYPMHTGIVANTMFVAGVNPRAPFNTGDHRQLLKLEEVDGRVVTTDTLGEILQRHGRKLVVVSSGSTGSAFMLNSRAPHGAGVVIHGSFDRGKVAAYPHEISDEVLKRFGAPPPEPDEIGLMKWTDTVLRDYVLPQLRPDVVIDWIGPLDSAQHDHAVGSPQAKQALHAIDTSLDLSIKKIAALGLLNETDILILSDHGFALNTNAVNVNDALVEAGLKKDRESSEIVVAGGEAVQFYVTSHDQAVVEKLVRFLQHQSWADVIFARGGKDGRGAVSGTISLDVFYGSHPTRQPDVAVSMAWTSKPNTFGVPGTQTTVGRTTGPLEGAASGHGGLNPWVVRNTFVAWGADFKRAAKTEAPVSMADVVPTILTLFKIEPSDTRSERGRGRVLRELFRNGPSRPDLRRRDVTTAAGSYQASVQISTVDGHDYVDGGSRR